MGRAQSQTRGLSDLFDGIMPRRRGINDDGLSAQEPTRYGLDQMKSLLDELRAGQTESALRALQEHHGHDTPLLRELYESTLEALLGLWSEGMRDHHASNYLMLLGVQGDSRDEACMVDETPEEELTHLPPSQRKRMLLVHLRKKGEERPICYGAGPVSSQNPTYAVPYGHWLQAHLEPGGAGKRYPCGVCMESVGFYWDMDTDVNQPVRRPHAPPLGEGVSQEIRVRTDEALRQLLGSQDAIKPRTGQELASKQYKRGVCAEAALTLRSDQDAFERLCFMAKRREMARLQKMAEVPIREVPSEEQWLTLLVSNFPSSTDEAVTNGIKKHWYSDAALMMIEHNLRTEGKSLKVAA